MSAKNTAVFHFKPRLWWVLAVALSLNVLAPAIPTCINPHISNDSWTETVVLDHVSHNPPDWCSLTDHEYKFTRNITQEIWSNGLRYSCPYWQTNGCDVSYTPVHALPNCPQDSCTSPAESDPDPFPSP